jgi:hypothetical protein
MTWDLETYFFEGFIARSEGVKRSANPYPRWSSAWAGWLSGWDMSERQGVKLSKMVSSLNDPLEIHDLKRPKGKPASTPPRPPCSSESH